MLATETSAHLGQAAVHRGDAVFSALSDAAGVLLLASYVFVHAANFRPGAGADVSLDWQIAFRLGLTAACGLYGLCHLGRTLDILLRYPAVLLTLFWLWSAITTPFAESFTHAAASVGALACILLFAVAVFRQLGKSRTVIVTAASLMFLLIGSWIVHWTSPEDVLLYKVDGGVRLGGLGHPNTTGMYAGMAAILLIVLGVERWVSWWKLSLPLGVALASLVVCDSRTATAATAAAALTIGLRRVKGLALLALVSALTAVVCLCLCVWLGLGLGQGVASHLDGTMAGLSRTGDAEEITSLNSRTVLWPLVLQKINQSPVAGYGFGCQRFVISELNTWAQYHPHNQLLHVVLGIGWPGGLLLIGMFMSMFLSRLRSADTFPDAVMVFLLVSGLAHSVIFTPLSDSATLVWMIVLCWRRVGEPVKSRPVSAVEEGANL